MPTEEEREEYVLSDSGYLYMGSFRQIREKPWNFGQVAGQPTLGPCGPGVGKGGGEVGQPRG